MIPRVTYMRAISVYFLSVLTIITPFESVEASSTVGVSRGNGLWERQGLKTDQVRLPAARLGNLEIAGAVEQVSHAIDSLVSAEFQIGNAIFSSTGYRAFNPVVSFDGANFLVVWSVEIQDDVLIYGTRVSRSGVVLDPWGIPICEAGKTKYDPAVASNGRNWLVVWSDNRNDSGDIYGTVVAPTGEVADVFGFPMCRASNQQVRPAVSSDGHDYFVAWEDHRDAANTSGDIYGARVSGDGSVLDPNGFAICVAPQHQSQVAVGCNGATYLVAWTDEQNGFQHRAVYATLISPEGAIAVPNGLPVLSEAGQQLIPAVASNGRDFLVAWLYCCSDALGSDIHGARIDGRGVLMDQVAISVSTAPGWQGDEDSRLSAASNGKDYLVVWNDFRSPESHGDIYGARITSSGRVAELNDIPISIGSDYQITPSVASDGSDYLLVFQSGAESDSTDIVGSRIGASGVVHTAQPVLLSTTGNSQIAPAVAYNGHEYFVVWVDLLNRFVQGTAIRGSRVSNEGKTLDPGGIDIKSGGDLSGPGPPVVAASGNDFLVVWPDNRNRMTGTQIYGSRVKQNGVVLDPEGVPISPTSGWQLWPAIAGNAFGYLLVWFDQRASNAPRAAIYGIKIDQSGLAMGREFKIADISWSVSPKVAASDNNYLVVWPDIIESPGQRNRYAIYGARVDLAGSLLDPSGFTITSNNWSAFQPAVAARADDYLAVWVDGRSAITNSAGTDIYGARVSQNGEVLDSQGIRICGAATDQLNPAVAGDGSRWLVVWEDNRNFTGGDLYGGLVSATGVSTIDDGFLISRQRYQPAVTAGRHSDFLLVHPAPTRSVPPTQQLIVGQFVR